MIQTLQLRVSPLIFTCLFLVSCGGSDKNTKAPQVAIKPPPDVTAPVITLNGPALINLWQGEEYEELGATAFDDTDGELDVSISGQVTPNTAATYTVTYQATDKAGNSSSLSRTVEVVADETAPTLVLKGASALTLFLNDEYLELGATANDNKDGELTVKTTGEVNTNETGTYNVQYSVQDSSGNKSELERQVTVYSPLSIESSVLVDLDNDKKIDLVTVSTNEQGIQLSWLPNALENTPNNLVNIALFPNEPFSLFNVFDANGDGAQDLSLVTESNWYLLSNKGMGDFSPAQNVLSNWLTIETSSESDKQRIIPKFSLASGDVNGDGITDLIWYSYYSLFDDDSPTESKINLAFGTNTGSYGSTLTLASGSNFTMSDILTSVSFELLDADKNKIFDIIVEEYTYDYTQADSGTATLSQISYKDGERIESELLKTDYINTYYLNDENKDGITDLHIKQRGFEGSNTTQDIWFESKPEGGFAPAKLLNPISKHYSLNLDLNNDGLFDLVGVDEFDGTNMVYWQQATEQGLLESKPLFRGAGSLTFKDIDHDGDLDFVYLANSRSQLQLHQSNGQYTEKTIFAPAMLKQRIGYEQDKWAPVITLYGAHQKAHPIDTPYFEPGGFATDETDGVVTLSMEGSVDITTEGQYSITYTATDQSGNTSSITRVIIVESNLQQ